MKVSIYEKGEITAVETTRMMQKLSSAFPTIRDVDFFGIITERAVVKGFTNGRLSDAVNYAIDNCKTLSIADIIGFDITVEYLTYDELCDVVDKGGKCDDYECRELNGKKYWTKK